MANERFKILLPNAPNTVRDYVRGINIRCQTNNDAIELLASIESMGEAYRCGRCGKQIIDVDDSLEVTVSGCKICE